MKTDNVLLVFHNARLLRTCSVPPIDLSNVSVEFVLNNQIYVSTRTLEMEELHSHKRSTILTLLSSTLDVQLNNQLDAKMVLVERDKAIVQSSLDAHKSDNLTDVNPEDVLPTLLNVLNSTRTKNHVPTT